MAGGRTRAAVLVVVGAVWALGLGGPPVHAQDLQAQLSPTSGPVGTQVSVTGSGCPRSGFWEGHDGVLVFWDFPEGNFGAQHMFFFNAEADGTFAFVWVVPERNGRGHPNPPGTYEVNINCVEGQVDTAFTITEAAADPPPVRSTESACPPGQVPPAGFTDVAAGNPHRPSIDCVVWWGVASGQAPGSYNPAGSVTRAQMASFIARMLRATDAGLPEATHDHFRDDDGSPHEPNINALASAGIVTGRADGTYGPSDAVTRAQMATFLVRAAEYALGRQLPTAAQAYFVDVRGSVHEANIGKAAEAGLAAGTGSGRFEPERHVARDQMATFVARTLALFVDEGRARPPY